jgi:hypothetical protein
VTPTIAKMTAASSGSASGPHHPGLFGPVEQLGDSVDDVRPDAGLVVDIALPSKDLVQAAVGGKPRGGPLEEHHDGGPGVVDLQRFLGVGADLLGRVGQDLGRDDFLVREMPVGTSPLIPR